MPWNGSGSTSVTQDFNADYNAGPPASLITSTKVQDALDDIASMIQNCINKNGENSPTANISWNSKRITSLGAATSPADGVNANQVANGSILYCGTTSGSANAHTLAHNFMSGTTLTTGQIIRAIAGFTNTGVACTLAMNGGSALAITQLDGVTLPPPKAIYAGNFFSVIYDGTKFRLIPEAKLFAAVAGNPLDVYNTSDTVTNEVARFSGANATRAANDNIYKSYYLANSAGTQKEFARQLMVAETVTASAENGRFIWAVMNAGTITNTLALTSTALQPATTGATALGSALVPFGSAFFGSTKKLDWGNGDVTVTHSTGTLTLNSVAVAGIASVNSGPLAGFRNKLINGNFDIWQRAAPAAGATGSNYYADRWRVDSVGTTYNYTQQAFTAGQTAVPGEPTYFLRVATATVAGASNYCILVHHVEDVRTFAGQATVISFWAKADTTRNAAIDIVQSFGTGGSPSVDTANATSTTTLALTTTWTKYYVTVTPASISGKTLGTTANTSNVRLRIWMDAGSTYNATTNTLGQQSGTFDFARAQWEPGSTPTEFERRPPQTELALCQRYYEKSFNWTVAPAQNSAATYAGGMETVNAILAAGAVGRWITMFKVPKRGSGLTATLYNPSAANASPRNNTRTSDCTSPTLYMSDRSIVIEATLPASTISTDFIWFHWSADADF